MHPCAELAVTFRRLAYEAEDRDNGGSDTASKLARREAETWTRAADCAVDIALRDAVLGALKTKGSKR